MKYRQLRLLIDKLEQPQRDVVMLRIYGRLKFKEIAAHLGISVNAAKQRYRRAKYNLRQMRRVMDKVPR